MWKRQSWVPITCPPWVPVSCLSWVPSMLRLYTVAVVWKRGRKKITPFKLGSKKACWAQPRSLASSCRAEEGKGQSFREHLRRSRVSGAACTGFDWHLRGMDEKKNVVSWGRKSGQASAVVFASNCKHPLNFILTSLICNTSKQGPNAPEMNTGDWQALL